MPFAYYVMMATVGALGAVLVVQGLLPGRGLLQERLGDQVQQQEQLVARYSSPFTPVNNLRQRVLGPAVGGLARLVERLMPAAQLRAIDQQFVLLGDPFGMSAAGFVTFALVTCFAGLLLGVLLVIALASEGTLAMVIPLAGGVVGLLLPRAMLQRARRRREVEIVRDLPDVLDLLTISLESGMGLDAGILHVANQYRGHLGNEFRRYMGELDLGRTRKEALQAMAERNQIPDLELVTSAIIQATALGTELGPTLRAQAEEARRRRRQRAEEAAAKSPLKMLFPMVGCIFPAMFVVLLGPALVLALNANH